MFVIVEANFTYNLHIFPRRPRCFTNTSRPFNDRPFYSTGRCFLDVLGGIFPLTWRRLHLDMASPVTRQVYQWHIFLVLQRLGQQLEERLLGDTPWQFLPYHVSNQAIFHTLSDDSYCELLTLRSIIMQEIGNDFHQVTIGNFIRAARARQRSELWESRHCNLERLSTGILVEWGWKGTRIQDGVESDVWRNKPHWN